MRIQIQRNQKRRGDDIKVTINIIEIAMWIVIVYLIIRFLICRKN